jgi:hypothetical protein
MSNLSQFPESFLLFKKIYPPGYLYVLYLFKLYIMLFKWLLFSPVN